MLQRMLIVFALTLPLAFGGCATNPLTGEDELMFFGPDSDIELGKKYAPELQKQMGGPVPDDALQNYIAQVGRSVSSVSHNPEWEYEFTAVQDDMVNAFALPGGKIFITRGMLEKLSSEAQLASILAHETAHVVARDTSAAMSRQIGMTLLLAAAVSQTDSRAAASMAQLTAQIISLKYSRTDERQADIAGLDYLVKAGYNPAAMVETMEILNELAAEGDRPPEFLSTHPNPENRVQYLSNRIESVYYGLPNRKIGRADYKKYVLDVLPKTRPPEELKPGELPTPKPRPEQN